MSPAGDGERGARAPFLFGLLPLVGLAACAPLAGDGELPNPTGSGGGGGGLHISGDSTETDS